MNNGFNNPSRLYVSCLNYICNNLDLICVVNNSAPPPLQPLTKPTVVFKQFEFRDKSVKFNHAISEDFLERLCQLGKLNDSTIQLFINNQTCLKKFNIRNVCLSKELIKLVLKQHKINELCINNVQFISANISEHTATQPNDEYSSYLINASNFSLNNNVTGNVAVTSQAATAAAAVTSGVLANNNSNQGHTGICINDLTESLNEWSQVYLKSLNVSRNATLFGSILINLNKLKNLAKLNVSYTCFNNHSLDIITQDLGNLEFLDISGTKVNNLNSLARLRDKLKCLYMYNMRASIGDDIVPVVCRLRRLANLDLSCDVSNKIFQDMSLSLFDVNYLLDELATAMLADLKYLDISGKVSIKQESLL
jgi:hypothetical protein